MSKLKVIRERDGIIIIVAFMCPGCQEEHHVWVNKYKIEYNNATWGWNQSMDKPTFTPSILVTSGHYVQDFKQGDNCWCTYNAEHPEEPTSFKCQRCHSYVTDGRIQFLGDCSHELKNSTVELPEI